MTFSSTVMPSNVCGTWKVRARPSSARASGARRVMSLPSNITCPEVETRSPVRQLKKVDLPAPLGPISPRISPCCSVTLAASTARKLPKALVMARASRSMGRSLLRGQRRGRLLPACPEPVDQGQDAAGLKPRDQDDDRAIEHEGQAGARATQPVVGNFLERHQNGRPYQRPEQK